MNAAEYKQRMIARKAAAAGMTVEAFLAKGERDHALSVRIGQIRADVRSATSRLVNGVMARGNQWVWG